MPPLTSKNGNSCWCCFSFATCYLSQLEEKKSDKVIVIFDRKTFRNDIFEEYKANRGEAPEDLIPQFGIIRSCGCI